MTSRAKAVATTLVLAAAVLALALWRTREADDAWSPMHAPAPAEAADAAVRLEGPAGGDTASRTEPDPAPVAEPVEAAPEPEGVAETAPPPIGALEVLVLRGDAPVDGGWVYVHGGGLAWLPREPSQRAMTLPIGGDGIARASGLAPGPYMVGAEVDPGIAHQLRVEIPEGEGARVVIRLGEGRVKGHVWDDSGALAEGARVQVSSVEGSRPAGVPVSKQHSVVVWTGADGAYDVPAVPAGLTWLAANLGGAQNGPGRDEMLSIQLAEKETRVIDFGRPERTPVWSGTVRNLAGDAVPNHGPPGTTGTLHVLNSKTEGFQQFVFEEDGTFRIPLQPGTYKMTVNPPSRRQRQPLFDAFVMEDADREQDVTIEGARVTGTVVRSASGEPVAPRMQVFLKRAEGGRSEFGCRVAADGAYTIDGVDRGTWQVSTYPNRLVEDVLVRVEKDAPTVRQDLTVE